MAPISSSTFLSEKEAAAYLSVSLSTIRRWRRQQNGPEYFRFGDVLRYSRAALGAFIVRYTKTVA
jgi:excisionase family DNA binding protein